MSDALTIYISSQRNGWESDVWRGSNNICSATGPTFASVLDIAHNAIIDADPQWADFNANEDL